MDFEGQRVLDRDLDESILEKRDRTIYREMGESDATNRRLIRRWLDVINEQRPLKSSPGQQVKTAYLLLCLYGGVVALISGWGAAFFSLRYDGSVPVNVSLFLGIIVIPQILLLLGYLPLVLLGAFRTVWIAPLYGLPARIGKNLIEKIWNSLAKRSVMRASTRDDAQLRGQHISSILQLHKGLFANRAFQLFQIAGIAFNLGVLACTCVLLMFTDRAFGWQSSLVDSPEKVESIVQTVAIPWKEWMPNEIAYPSYDQIVGSRIILRESDSPLASKNLLAWWPFLLLCVGFYGLFPRVFAWVISLWNERRLLGKLAFDSYAYAHLVERMKAVALHSHGASTERRVDEGMNLSHPPEDNPDLHEIPNEITMLHDTAKRYSEEVLRDCFFQHSGRKITQITRVEGLLPEHWIHAEQASVILLMEGWQPPIQETLDGIGRLANHLSQKDGHLHLFLIGKPGPSGPKTLSPSMMEVWQKKTQLLGCPNLRVETSVSTSTQQAP